VVHAPPAQQPDGHEVAVQRHVPNTHCWPAAQAGPPPQVHAPFVHALAVAGLQATQAAPPVPHAFADGVTHAPPAQQPFGHEVALHWHMPPTQRWPAAQAGPPPQVHAPFVHASARVGSHGRQAPPPVPHAPVDGVVQVEPAQQPDGHVAGSHTQAPPRQRWPAAQAGPVPQAHRPFAHPSASFRSHGMQAPPPAPHALADGVVQVVPEQHPVGQD
jgi:hypothetical protein